MVVFVVTRVVPFADIFVVICLSSLLLLLSLFRSCTGVSQACNRKV